MGRRCSCALRCRHSPPEKSCLLPSTCAHMGVVKNTIHFIVSIPSQLDEVKLRKVIPVRYNGVDKVNEAGSSLTAGT